MKRKINSLRATVRRKNNRKTVKGTVNFQAKQQEKASATLNAIYDEAREKAGKSITIPFVGKVKLY